VRPPGTTELQARGLDASSAARLAAEVEEVLRRVPEPRGPREQAHLWREFRDFLTREPWRWNFEVHRLLFETAYQGRSAADGPAPAWFPTPEIVAASNLARLMAERGIPTYGALHRWSVERREEFWSMMIRLLGIRFRTDPSRILQAGYDATCPEWLPGASLNIAESCFRADPARTAIVHASEEDPTLRRLTYGELRRLANRVAGGLEDLGVAPGERVALYLPMVPEAVAAYLGTILAGRCVVGIADTSPPQELAKRVRIGGAKAIVTSDAYVRDGKEHRIYEKVCEADAPRAVVVPARPGRGAEVARSSDLTWDDFLSDRDAFDAVPCRPSDPTNILFSSGTTKDPKAIPWTQVTPIKAAADAFLHHDVHPEDVLAWPTSFGWMMGPWLTYGTLVNGASMALYLGAPHRRDAGEFLVRAGVSILGVVPKIVRSWKADRTMEGLDWGRIRLFSSTAEPSTPGEMLYLMFLAGYRPVVEYCGGTEVGGGYVTGTVVQPCAPSTFTTPAMGIDFVLLDEGRGADRGEVFLVPPSIGLSNDLLNYDHRHEYFDGAPPGPGGEVLRRHGDQLERLGGGFYRHHGRVDDMVNIHGVKTSAEEIRSVIGHAAVYDAKPVAVDADGSGQQSLVIYAVPRDATQVGSAELAARLRGDFERSIKEELNPLLAHVREVVLVPELPQAGPGKTRTMADLRKDYFARLGDRGSRG